MQPSFSGWLVTWAYFPQTTFPELVTSPSSLTFTSMTVPRVMTPSSVYMEDCGFFLTPMMSSWKVALSSGCVTCAFLKRRPIGLINRSYLGGFRVNPSPTKVTLVTIRFHSLAFRLPVRRTLNTSSSATGFTRGRGTDHFPALSFLFCLIVFDRTFARLCNSLSSKYAGTAPSFTLASCSSSSSPFLGPFRFFCFSAYIAIVFFICTFSLKRRRLCSLALIPVRRCATSDRR
mmetsp:Transcript_1815/g.3305  ORF Transcript_1815/g.3305 Transcript_1815/m.3305 type:complete len:232 (-) Transcript_1815:192-887(-)